MSLLNIKDIKGMRIQVILMTVLVAAFLFAGIFGYRMLDVFGAKEWEREGPPGPNGNNHYYHK